MLSEPLLKSLNNQEASLLCNSNANPECSINNQAAETLDYDNLKTFIAIYWERELQKLNEKYQSEWDNVERGGLCNKVSASPVSIHPELIIEDDSEEEEEKVMSNIGGTEENYDSP